MKIGIIGLGLMGGSYVKGLNAIGYDVYGWDNNQETFKEVYSLGLIKNSASDLNLLSNMDVVIICLHPDRTLSFLRDHQGLIKSGAIVTDIIGLKYEFMQQVKQFLREDINFIGGHPMAGKEGAGFSQSSEKIFYESNYLLIDEDIAEVHFEKLESILYQLGCKNIKRLDSINHDQLITYTSHMPHILSTVFMNANRRDIENCVAGSFRDISRVSDINVELWGQLIWDNKDLVLDEIAHFKSKLDEIQKAIETEKKDVETFLSQAKRKKISLKL